MDGPSGRGSLTALSSGAPRAILRGFGTRGAEDRVDDRDVASRVGPMAAATSLPRAERELGIDALRGLAVFTMVGANMVPYMLDEPYPFWLRLYASLAAPAFILLAGFMMGHLHVRRPMPLTRHLKRALGLLVVAALVDVVLWGDEPFATFDVLYLIALVLPASHLALCLPRAALALVVAVIFLATPVLRVTVGYETEVANPIWQRVQALFVDGWFPVFPWLGVGILGAGLGAFRQARGHAVFARRAAMLGGLLLASGAILWRLTAPELRTAGEFAELFYPPTVGVLFATLGPVICLLALLSGRVAPTLLRGLAVYGRAALAMYVVHLAVIAFVIKRWCDHQTVMTFVLAYLAHAALLWWLALGLRRLRPAPRSFWGRLLLGS
jgi:uncharacterized membrane protein